MGYQVATLAPPNMAPSAAAAFPSMRTLPRFLSIRSSVKGSCLTSFSRAWRIPISTARRFNSTAAFLLRNWLSMAPKISSTSIDSSSPNNPT